MGLSFEENLKTFMNKEKTPPAVQKLVWEAVEAE
jgi:hypothetical protein